MTSYIRPDGIAGQIEALINEQIDRVTAQTEALHREREELRARLVAERDAAAAELSAMYAWSRQVVRFTDDMWRGAA